MTEQSLIPAFSLAERERRWRLVRRRMAEENLDCLIGFPNQGRFEQLQANTRYLVPIGGFATEVAVVFPLDDEVTAIVQTARDVGWWSGAQDWVSDLRPYRRLWSEGIIARLQELGLGKGSRVGVIGLSGLMRAPEGVVSWTMFENVKAKFPTVEFVNATAVIEFGDAMLLGMAFPNLVGVVMLSGRVKRELDTYLGKLKAGEFQRY